MNDKMLARVRALLDRAEHPNTPQAEAEAATVKAAELMTRYGIDQALAHQRGERADPMTHHVTNLGGSWGRERGSLLAAIALAWHCYPIIHRRGRTVTRMTVWGHQSDLDRVAMLYASVSLQALRDVRKLAVPEWTHPAAYRRSWLAGYAVEIGDRLRRAEQTAIESVSTGTDLVLADRSSHAKAAAENGHQNLGPDRGRTLYGHGFTAGRRAGERADLGDRSLTGTIRPRLTESGNQQ